MEGWKAWLHEGSGFRRRLRAQPGGEGVERRVTGAVEYIGPLHHMNFAGPEIDACGDFYVTGFEVGAPETGGEPKFLFGDSNLYKIHKKTGEMTVIGDTGRTDWMDLEFDRQGRLWATTRNELYRIDTKTAAATLVTPIHGVPTSDIPGTCPEDWEWMEVMSIAFDQQGVLWGTAMKGFSLCFDNNSPVLRIDTRTGNATVVGYTGSVPLEGGFNHGGDIVLGPGGRCAD